MVYNDKILNSVLFILLLEGRWFVREPKEESDCDCECSCPLHDHDSSTSSIITFIWKCLSKSYVLFTKIREFVNFPQRTKKFFSVSNVPKTKTYFIFNCMFSSLFWVAIIALVTLKATCWTVHCSCSSPPSEDNKKIIELIDMLSLDTKEYNIKKKRKSTLLVEISSKFSLFFFPIWTKTSRTSALLGSAKVNWSVSHMGSFTCTY